MSRAGATARAAAAAPTPATSGLLAVDKPAGPTSHDVVAQVRRALPAPGAGHLGTLDPPATGLLLVAVGAATRCVTLWQGGEKTYEAVIRFGVETSTDDLAGDRTGGSGACPDEAAIRAATAGFVGELLQVPPAVSAIHVGGARLHALARAGRAVMPAPRPVTVREWTWLEFALPDARARIRCSGGTYVRALARDLGRTLGCGAAVASLRRLRSEPFGLERAVTVEDLRGDGAALWARAGIPLAEALGHLPAVTVAAAERERLGHGNAIARSAAGGVAAGTGAAGPGAGGSVVLRDEAGVPLAIAEWRGDPADPARAWLQPRVVFPWTVAEAQG